MIKRKGKSYCRTIPSHGIVQKVEDLYSSDLPRRSIRQKPVGGKVGRPPSTIAVADSGEEVTSPLSGANSNNLTRKTPNVETRNTRNTQKSR